MLLRCKILVMIWVIWMERNKQYFEEFRGAGWRHCGIVVFGSSLWHLLPLPLGIKVFHQFVGLGRLLLVRSQYVQLCSIIFSLFHVSLYCESGILPIVSPFTNVVCLCLSLFYNVEGQFCIMVSVSHNSFQCTRFLTESQWMHT